MKGKQPKSKGMKKYVKYPIKALLIMLNKVSICTYKRAYPRYLRWLGVDISENFSSYGDPWISPKCIFDAAGYNMISIGDNVTISYDVSILVHDFSIDKVLYAEDGCHGKLLGPVSIGQNCFIGASTLILPGTRIGENRIVGGGVRCQRSLPQRIDYLRESGSGYWRHR